MARHDGLFDDHFIILFIGFFIGVLAGSLLGTMLADGYNDFHSRSLQLCNDHLMAYELDDQRGPLCVSADKFCSIERFGSRLILTECKEALPI